MVDLEAAEVTVEAVEVQCEVSLPMEIEEALEVTAEILTRPPTSTLIHAGTHGRICKNHNLKLKSKQTADFVIF